MATSGRDRITMTEDEVGSYLAGQRKVQVATLGRDGSPHLTTLFHVVREDGRLAFWTYATSQKVRNLERDPRITCLVEDGESYFDLRGVSLTGQAELLRDPVDVRAIGTAIATRIAERAGIGDLGDAGRAEVERQVPKRVGVVVTPRRVVSWDHGKL